MTVALVMFDHQDVWVNTQHWLDQFSKRGTRQQKVGLSANIRVTELLGNGNGQSNVRHPHLITRLSVGPCWDHKLSISHEFTLQNLLCLSRFVPPISLASNLWRLWDLWYKVVGVVDSGPRDFSSLEWFYLPGLFCIRAFAWNLLTPCVHSKYARGHVLRSRNSHACACTRPFSVRQGLGMRLVDYK